MKEKLKKLDNTPKKIIKVIRDGKEVELEKVDNDEDSSE